MSKYNTAVVLKILNNNCVLVRHDHKQKVFFGKGIGYSKKQGDNVGDAIVEKVFIENL